jgi:hypothetical protein
MVRIVGAIIVGLFSLLFLVSFCFAQTGASIKGQSGVLLANMTEKDKEAFLAPFRSQ